MTLVYLLKFVLSAANYREYVFGVTFLSHGFSKFLLLSSYIAILEFLIHFLDIAIKHQLALVISARVKRELHDLMWDWEEDPSKTGSNEEIRYRKTARCKEYHQLQVAYNNVLSFCSEAAKMNYKHSGFSTFRCMGGG